MAAESTPSDALEEVVVTAQRRVENLQDVPISALVLTGDMLADKGVTNITNLQYAAPGLTLAEYGSANVLNIRGVGRSAVDIELPSGVVLYRDGMPTFPGYFQNEPYFDVASIEVLRGPQGTFVGKSAAGGAIFIRTAAPDLSGFSGKVEGEVGNFGQIGTTIVVNEPIGDTFGMRVAYYQMKRDEIMVDSLSGPYTGRPGRPDLNSFRIGALWKPSDSFTADLRIDSADLDFGGNLTSSYGYPLYDIVNNSDFAYRDRTVRGVGDMKYTFANGLILSSVTGYQRSHTTNNFDRNGNNPAYNRFDSQGLFKLYSEELDLISPESDGPLSYVAGIFLQRTDSIIYNWRQSGFNISFCGPEDGCLYPFIGLDTDYTKREDELSGFVDLKYELSTQWEAELGLRYSQYKNKNDINIVVGNEVDPPTFPLGHIYPELTEDDFDGKLSLTYKIRPDQNIYGLISRGHVVGGFNIVGGAEFQKEVIWDYEAGWKATWANGRVRTQLGGYYQTLSDYQAQFASPDLPGQNILQNGDGQSKIYGLEASVQAALSGWNIDASFAYLHSRLGTFNDVLFPALSPDPVTITGGQAPFSPEFSFSVGVGYEILAGDGITVTPRVDASSQSSQSGSLADAPQTHKGGRTLVNAQLRVEKGKWYGELYGMNLTDKRYLAGVQDLGNIWYPGTPRQYGLRAGLKL
jgi:iron complex outermembrane receptor protein